MGGIQTKYWVYDQLGCLPSYQRKFALANGTARHTLINESKNPNEVVIMCFHPGAHLASGRHNISESEMEGHQARGLGFSANTRMVEELERSILQNENSNIRVSSIAVTHSRLGNKLTVPSPCIQASPEEMITLSRDVEVVPYETDQDGKSLDHPRLTRYVAQANGAFADPADMMTSVVGALRTPLSPETEFDNYRLFLRNKMQSSQNIIILYPIYWGSTPAICQAVMEQCICPGEAYLAPPEGNPPKAVASFLVWWCTNIMPWLMRPMRRYMFQGLWRDKNIYLVGTCNGVAGGSAMLGVPGHATEYAMYATGAKVHRMDFGGSNKPPLSIQFPPTQEAKVAFDAEFLAPMRHLAGKVARNVKRAVAARQDSTYEMTETEASQVKFLGDKDD